VGEDVVGVRHDLNDDIYARDQQKTERKKREQKKTKTDVTVHWPTCTCNTEPRIKIFKNIKYN
jgi:hypothetical protein